MFDLSFKIIIFVGFGLILCTILLYLGIIKFKTKAINKIKKSFEFDKTIIEERIKNLEKERNHLTSELTNLKKKYSTNINKLTEISIDKSALEQAVLNIPKLEAEINKQIVSREKIIKYNINLEKKVSELTALLTSERKHLGDKTTILSETKKNILDEFKTIISSTFKLEGTKFSTNNKTQMDAMINPFREQLYEFKKKVEDVYEKESKDRYLLLNEIDKLKFINARISKDAINLTRALKGNIRVQGCWGELTLERILEISGLQKGRAYDLQIQLKQSHDNKYYRPDVIVRLPEGRDVIIDSKVSLKNYESYCSSNNKSDKKIELRKHIKSIKTHIKNLASKQYHNLEEIKSLDFVLMFIPIEEAFFIAVRKDTSIILESFKNNVFIVCPSTLLITLRTINNIWRGADQNKNSVEIARKAGEMYDKFTSLVQSIDEIGKQLTKATSSYTLAKNRLSEGRGNLIKRAQDLKNLGLKTKKNLSKSIINSD